MSSGPSGDRPVTSKARGICRYYNTSRGCYAGDSCKFLHGEAEKYTPHDKSKTCRYYAAGFCSRGDQCWFLHGKPKDAMPSTSKLEEDEYDVCCICYEKPVTYGLLEGCSHQYCLKCIREWRDPSGKSEEVRESRVNKMCPLCRAPSRFVTPSSLFYADGHPGKVEAIGKYKASMARTPCRHFVKSPANDRFCPFGKECFYQHLNDDGTPYVFKYGADHYMRIYSERRAPQGFVQWFETDFDEMLDNIADLNTTFQAVRSALPAMSIQLPEPQSAGNGGEDDGMRAETMQRLVTLMANIEEFFGSTTNLVESTRQLQDGAPPEVPTLDLPDTEEIESSVDPLFSPEPEEAAIAETTVTTSELPADSSIPDYDARSHPPSPISASSSATSSVANPRFSTVVRGRGHYVVDSPLDNYEEGRSLPATAETHPEPVPATASLRAIAADDVPVEAPPSFVEDLEQRMRDILHADAPQPSVSDPAPSSAAAADAATTTTINAVATTEAQPEQTKTNAPDFTTLQEPDPPFLTDGRGRVVWSSTTAAARYRESRRGRASTGSSSTAQQKSSDAARTPSRPRQQLARAHTCPEVSQPDVGCSSLADDGRGRILAEPGPCSVAQEVAPAPTGVPGLEAESTDGAVELSDARAIL